MNNARMNLWSSLAISALGSSVALAQTITGSVRGTVTDARGATIQGATVTATNAGTGVVSTTRTNSSGSYVIQFLPIGSYRLESTAPGFSTQSFGPFTLEIDQVAEVNARLDIGQSSTTVNVTSEAVPILNTENATLGTSVSANQLQEMPLNGLNVLTATLFTPGTVNPTAPAMGGLEGSYRETNQDSVPSFNGNRKQGNNFVLDGIEINETIANTSGYNPSPYSLQEMRIITGNADAEYGNVNGGEVLMVTKGGTNKLHGSLFEYFKNESLSANSWGNNYSGIAKSRFNQNQFGGSIGGPILHDKLFFFGDYEGLIYRTPPSQAISSVPTALERNGDFSEILNVEGIQLYNTTNGTAAAVPYKNNQLPTISNPVATYLFAHPSALPLPNHAPQAGTVAAGNYVGYSASQNLNNQADGRIDINLRSSDSIMVKGTYGDAHDNATQVPLAISFPTTNDYPFYMGAVSWAHTFNSALVNEFRAGYSRIGQSTSVSDPTGLFGTNGNSLLGIPLSGQSVPGFTQIMISNSEVGGFGTAATAGIAVVDNNFDYSDNFTWVHGKHITKIGAQFVRYQENYFNPSNLGGVLGNFAYSGVYTAAGSSVGDGFADFELDKAQSASVSGQSGPFGQRQWRDAYYAQDDWKAQSNLTFNIGLRYAYTQPMYEANNKMVTVDLQKAYFAPVGTPISSMLHFAGVDGNSRALTNPYYLQFMPRVGFNYQLTPKFVVRGGYAITDALEGTGSGLRMTQNTPFTTSSTVTALSPSPTSGGTPLQVANGFSGGVSSGNQQYDVWDPNIKPESVQQFNLTTQTQIGRLTSLQIGYVGELGRHLATPVLGNQYIAPVPTTCAATDTSGCVDLVAPYYALVGQSQVAITSSRSVESYNALQVSVRQQETNGLEFTANYTYSKSMTNNPGGFFNVDGTLGGLFQFWQNSYSSTQDYGNSAFDVPHSVNGTAVYKLPFGHGKQYGGSWNRLEDEALGGWELSANASFTSGYPISVYQNGNDNLNSAADNFNYNGYGTVNRYRPIKVVNRSSQHWFGTDPTATPCTTAGSTVNTLGSPCTFGLTNFNQFGTSAPNSERAPGYRNVDLSVFKAFHTFREQSAKFRFDGFNVFNLVSLAAPRSRVGSGSYGRITSSASAPRQFQGSFVYQF